MASAMLKITTKEKIELLLFTTYDDHQRLDIKILNVTDNEAYRGELNEIEMRSMAANIRMTYNIFTEETRKALCYPSSDDEEYLYSLENKCDMFSFKWKKRIVSEDIIISLGHLDVNKTNFASVLSDIWSLSSRQLRDLNDKIKCLTLSLETCERQRKEAVDLLSNASEAKDSLEKELFSKFVLILNTKKQKIRELKRKVGDYKQLSTKNNGNNGSRKSKTSKVILSDSSEDIDNDVEGILSKPSTSHSNASKRASLNFFDDVESGDSFNAKKSKVRNRKVVKSSIQCKPSQKEEMPTVKVTKVANCDNESDTDELLDFF